MAPAADEVAPVMALSVVDIDTLLDKFDEALPVTAPVSEKVLFAESRVAVVADVADVAESAFVALAAFSVFPSLASSKSCRLVMSSTEWSCAIGLNADGLSSMPSQEVVPGKPIAPCGP